jgi:hypothetical protein
MAEGVGPAFRLRCTSTSSPVYALLDVVHILSTLATRGTRVIRKDWLLLLIGDGLEPIRIQKGMFLFAMESEAPAREKYDFVPYNWGPFSRAIYDDLESLQTAGLVERLPVPGASHFAYRRTSAGDAAAERLSRGGSEALVASLRQARAAVSDVDFGMLLRRVYRKYPTYATKSLFKG